MENVFEVQRAIAARRYIINHTPEFQLALPVNTAAAAVVNASDTCSLSCPHCLYAAALVKKKATPPPAISMEQAAQFIKIMNEAQLEHLIFSGGGESYENLPVMMYMLENLQSLKQVVTVTSCYFSTTAEETAEIFDQLAQAIQRGNTKFNRSEVSFILRISYDNSHDVPTSSVVNAIQHFMTQKYEGIKLQVVVRTLLDPKENKDLVLANLLGATLLPVKDQEDPMANLPVIDGFPTRWLEMAGNSIPVIYKPTYFEGLAYKGRKRMVPGTSWQEIKAVEEEFDNFFNLSLRGKNGEGHNYYQTVLKGHGHWQRTLGCALSYNTPKSQADKGYSIYLPADGRLIVNASAPDSHVPVLSVNSWQDFLQLQAQDILQYHVISHPTDLIVELAREVETSIDEIIDRRNFVFSLAYTAMETPALRLYLTVRLLQMLASETQLAYADGMVQALVQTPADLLVANYQASGNTLATIDAKQSLYRDPIVGNEASIYTKE